MSLVCGTILLEVGSQQAVHVGGQGDKDVLDANVPVFRIGGEERVMQRMAADVDPVGHLKPVSPTLGRKRLNSWSTDEQNTAWSAKRAY